MEQLPPRDFYKLNEVCQYTDTQPYVLRFWESEFPQLQPRKTTAGQRLYRKQDIDVVRRIKELLCDQEYTLDAAREQLAHEFAEGSHGARAVERSPARPTAPARPGPSLTPETPHVARERVEPPLRPAAPLTPDSVPRQRYEDAVQEIDRLRLAVREAERATRRAEMTLDEARAAAELERERAERAVTHLEHLRELLS